MHFASEANKSNKKFQSLVKKGNRIRDSFNLREREVEVSSPETADESFAGLLHPVFDNRECNAIVGEV